jgi:DNA polymerase-3 subunit chi
MSTQVTFYAVHTDQLSDWTCQLADSASRKSMRMLIYCGDPAGADAIDAALWAFRPDAFVPHEVSQSEAAVDVPVLITTTARNDNSAVILVLMAPAPIAFARTFPNVIELVDQSDDERLQISRDRFRQWRALPADADVSVTYKDSRKAQSA